MKIYQLFYKTEVFDCWHAPARRIVSSYGNDAYQRFYNASLSLLDLNLPESWANNNEGYWNQFRVMADKKFHFSSGEILMKEVFFVFFFLDERTLYMMVSYSV